MRNLVINDTQIGTDSEGRFSLTDLHRAAGADPRLKPFLFLRSESVAKVTEVLKAQNCAIEPISIKRGRYTGGTWVCKELVYKYAMWVDAEFEVKVIQTFDQISNSGKAINSMQ